MHGLLRLLSSLQLNLRSQTGLKVCRCPLANQRFPTEGWSALPATED